MVIASVRARHSFEGPQRSVDRLSQMMPIGQAVVPAHEAESKMGYRPDMHAVSLSVDIEKAESSSSSSAAAAAAAAVPIPITVSPATPDGEEEIEAVLIMNGTTGDAEKEKERPKKERKNSSSSGDMMSKAKRSMSFEGENRSDTTKTKKVQQMFKDKVHKGRAGITAVSKKIGRNGGLRRSTSTPSMFFSLYF